MRELIGVASFLVAQIAPAMATLVDLQYTNDSLVAEGTLGGAADRR